MPLVCFERKRSCRKLWSFNHYLDFSFPLSLLLVLLFLHLLLFLLLLHLLLFLLILILHLLLLILILHHLLLFRLERVGKGAGLSFMQNLLLRLIKDMRFSTSELSTLYFRLSTLFYFTYIVSIANIRRLFLLT